MFVTNSLIDEDVFRTQLKKIKLVAHLMCSTISVAHILFVTNTFKDEDVFRTELGKSKLVAHILY